MNEMINKKKRRLRMELWRPDALKAYIERESSVLEMKGGENGHQSQMHQKSQIR